MKRKTKKKSNKAIAMLSVAILAIILVTTFLFSTGVFTIQEIITYSINYPNAEVAEPLDKIDYLAQSFIPTEGNTHLQAVKLYFKSVQGDADPNIYRVKTLVGISSTLTTDSNQWEWKSYTSWLMSCWQGCEFWSGSGYDDVHLTVGKTYYLIASIEIELESGAPPNSQCYFYRYSSSPYSSGRGYTWSSSSGFQSKSWDWSFSIGTTPSVKHTFTLRTNPTNCDVVISTLASPPDYDVITIATGNSGSDGEIQFELVASDETYGVRVSHDGYRTSSSSIVMDTDRTLSVKLISLTPQQPPSTPSLSGSISLNEGQTGTWSAYSIDPEGNQIQYVWVADSITVRTSSWKASGTTDSLSHSFSSTGTHVVKVKAVDADGQSSNWATRTIQVGSSNYMLTIQTIPMHCDVTVGSETKNSGSSGAVFYVTSGEHFVSVSKSGYNTATQTVLVSSKDTSVTINLASHKYDLTIFTVPGDCEVTVGGIGTQNSGTAGTTFVNLESRTYIVTVSKDGYTTKVENITIAGQDVIQTIELEAGGSTPSIPLSLDTTAIAIIMVAVAGVIAGVLIYKAKKRKKKR